MATGKARTAVLGRRRETKVYEDTIKQGRTAFLSAPMIAMLEGGVSFSLAQISSARWACWA